MPCLHNYYIIFIEVLKCIMYKKYETTPFEESWNPESCPEVVVLMSSRCGCWSSLYIMCVKQAQSRVEPQTVVYLGLIENIYSMSDYSTSNCQIKIKIIWLVSPLWLRVVWWWRQLQHLLFLFHFKRLVHPNHIISQISLNSFYRGYSVGNGMGEKTVDFMETEKTIDSKHMS